MCQLKQTCKITSDVIVIRNVIEKVVLLLKLKVQMHQLRATPFRVLQIMVQTILSQLEWY